MKLRADYGIRNFVSVTKARHCRVQPTPSNYLGPRVNVAFSSILHMSTSSYTQASQMFFNLRVSTNFISKLLISSTHPMCLAHLILHHNIWCNFLQPPVTSYLLGPHPRFVSDILCPCCSPDLRD
jgi:hypothetical protein